MIQLIFNALSLYLWSIIIHEIGHYFYLKVIAKQHPVIVMEIKDLSLFRMDAKLGVEADYEALDKDDRFLVYYSGVVFGFFVLAPAISMNVIYWILVPAYLWSCIPDIKNMIGCLKK